MGAGRHWFGRFGGGDFLYQQEVVLLLLITFSRRESGAHALPVSTARVRLRGCTWGGQHLPPFVPSTRDEGLAEADRVIGVVLLCAHPRNALYVEKWTFMCSLRGSKMGRLEAVLGQFRRCWGHEVPFLRCFGQIWPRNAI